MENPFYLNRKTLQYKVHPIVIFEILDHHRRRQSEKRVFGLLVGKKRRRVLEVTGALNIVVNIDEEKQEIPDIKLFKEMVDLHKITCPQDQVVGMYTTWHSPDYYFSMVHKQLGLRYPLFGENSLCLVVDANGTQNTLPIQGYTSKVILGVCRYVGVPIELKGSDVENLGVWTLINTPKASSLPVSQKTELQKATRQTKFDDNNVLWNSRKVVRSEMDEVCTSLRKFKDYVLDRSQRREEVGWDLASCLSEIPSIPEEEFESMISGSIQDLLMNINLSKLSKVHINLANKLNIQDARTY